MKGGENLERKETIIIRIYGEANSVFNYQKRDHNQKNIRRSQLFIQLFNIPLSKVWLKTDKKALFAVAKDQIKKEPEILKKQKSGSNSQTTLEN